tara:strand:- start:33542 stop:34585 length:1044 start_codon:yes stop_codon:yes gene_type:complete
MLILGIETSCDETAAAVVSDDRAILSNVILTQLEEHKPFGGVVPEIAARSHLQNLPNIIETALADAQLTFTDLDGVAATAGPGLIGGVMVGLMAAKSIALVHQLPFFAINHMGAHALTPRLTENIDFPYLALLVSGGHSQFVAVAGPNDHKVLGTTRDDAIGEAFDKSANLLGLPYPGGPEIEATAKDGNPTAYNLPRPLRGRPNCDFSFSGLKTAVRKLIERPETQLQEGSTIADIAASFQAAAIEITAERTQHAIEMFKRIYPKGNTLVAAGGVASNGVLRRELYNVTQSKDFLFAAPPVNLCTDNGAMVAWAGIERFKVGAMDSLDFAPRPRWPLDEFKTASQG